MKSPRMEGPASPVDCSFTHPFFPIHRGSAQLSRVNLSGSPATSFARPFSTGSRPARYFRSCSQSAWMSAGGAPSAYLASAACGKWLCASESVSQEDSSSEHPNSLRSRLTAPLLLIHVVPPVILLEDTAYSGGTLWRDSGEMEEGRRARGRGREVGCPCWRRAERGIVDSGHVTR